MKRMLGILSLVLVAMVGCNGNDTGIGGSGLIETNETLIAAETTGRVLELGFEEGSTVNIGDTLAIIDPSRVELELVAALTGREVAEANLRTAQVQVQQALSGQQFASKEFDRLSRLLKSGSGTDRQADLAEHEAQQATFARQAAEANKATRGAELSQIDAEIARLERQLADCFPKAMQSGIVTEQFVEVGELLAPGKPIVRLAQLDTVWVKVYLAAGNFANVIIGDEARVSTESGGKTFSGVIVWSASEAEFTPKNIQTEQARADLVYAVKVQIPNQDGSLKIGMPVFVTFDHQ